MKDITIKNRILEATISSIELYGIEGCTIRTIAKEAGVNLSSVHYYFESKEELVNAALNMAIRGSFDDIHKIWADERPDYKAALTHILQYLLQGAIRYPGITRAGLQPLLMQGKTDGIFIVNLNAFLVLILEELSKNMEVDCKVIELKLMQAFSTVLFLGIATDAYHEFSKMNMREEADHMHLIESLIETIIPD